MNDFNSNSKCEQARSYYYEYLCGETQVNIPEDITSHIHECNNCQTEIERLKFILAESTNKSDSKLKDNNLALITNTTLHFGHISELVTCRTLRPFLPSLADPLLKIGIPTPITVHLDKCQECESDLQNILELNLTHKQLCRLGQIFAEMPFESQLSCSEVQDSISDVACMVFKDLSEDILKHVCTCPDCRDLVFLSREKFIQKTIKDPLNDFPCEAVKNADLFDYCFPYGVCPETDEHVKFPSSFSSHVVNCPTCLSKTQGLHMAINDIIERDESGIATCYKVIDNSEHVVKEADSAENIYNDWPIKVEVIESSKEPAVYKLEAAAGLKSPVRSKQKVSRNKIVPILKYASAAAAIIILAAIFMNAPVASAVGLGEVYDALGQIRNAYITVFDEKASEISQEIWISQDLNIKMFKSNAQLVLWDLENQVQKAANLNMESIETIKLDPGAVSNTEETMAAPWGLLPFENTASLPRNAEWQKVSNEGIESLDSDTEVYDLIWSDKSMAGADVFIKYRVYLNTSTKLPYKTEFFERRGREEVYELLTTTNVSYPSIEEVKAMINQYGLE
ncbi:MAG: hypothetical protein ACYSUK_04290 [Planctomycetota bacterium]